MKKNQKGFTLVELVVVMAILSIIGIAIYGFFHTSSTAYNKTGAEVDLQYEAQLTLNQLDNMIIDSTKQLDYYYHTVSANNQPILSDADIPPEANVTGKTFIITNEDVAYKIDWDSATKKVNLTKMTPTVSSNSLMAEYVSGFHVSLERAKSQRVVEFHFDFMNKDKEYDTAHNVTMRNKIIVNGAAVSGNEVKKWWAIDKVRIFKDGNDVTDQTISVTSTGSEQQIELLAKVIGINNPSQDVVWTIAGNKDTATTISGNTANPCTVILGANESGDSIEVTATAVAKNEWDKDKARAMTRIKVTAMHTDEKLIRGGDGYVLDLKKQGIVLQPGDKVEWGFKSATRIFSGGNPYTDTSSLKQGQVWKDAACSGYNDPSWGEQKLEKLIYLEPQPDGTCKIIAGKDYTCNSLVHTTAFQVVVIAKVTHADGTTTCHQFGKDEVDKDDPLYMDQMYVNIVKPDGSQFYDYENVFEGCKVGESTMDLFVVNGHTISFRIDAYGYKIAPEIKLISASGEIEKHKVVYNSATREMSFTAANIGDKQQKFSYEISLAGNKIYDLNITVNGSSQTSE